MDNQYYSTDFFDESPVASPRHFEVVADVYPIPEGVDTTDPVGFFPIDEGFVNDGFGNRGGMEPPGNGPRLRFQDAEGFDFYPDAGEPAEEIEIVEMNGHAPMYSTNGVGHSKTNGIHHSRSNGIHHSKSNGIHHSKANGKNGSRHHVTNGHAHAARKNPTFVNHHPGMTLSFEEFLRTATLDSEVFNRTLSNSSNNSHGRLWSKEKKAQYPQLLSSGSLTHLENRMKTLQKASLDLRDLTSEVDQSLLLQAFTQLYR